jgi:flagellar export protein FliJ
MTRKTVSKVLELKGMTREQLEAETGRARSRHRTEELRLADLERRFSEASTDFASRQRAATMGMHDVELCTAYCSGLAQRIREQKEVVAVRSREVAEKELALVAAYREQRLVEILHDRLAREEHREQRAGEQKEVDERFLLRRTEQR